MTVNDLFSKDAAININRIASTLFGKHLFIFCEYEPTTIVPISKDAQYLAGALNLYKMYIDSGISVPLVKENRGGLSFEENSKWDKNIKCIGMLRTIYSHNIGDDQESMREYINWLRSIIKKDSFETMEDYSKGLSEIISMQTECCDLLRKYVNQTGTQYRNEAKKEFVQKWENLILHYYSKNDYKVFLAQVRIAMINKGMQPNKTTKIKVAMWFQNYYEYELMSSIRSVDDLIRRGRLSPEVITRLQEQKKQKQKSIQDIRNKVASISKNKSAPLRAYDYQDYYCSELERKLKSLLSQLKDNNLEDKEEHIANVTMLPNSILQLLIKKDFRNIPIT